MHLSLYFTPAARLPAILILIFLLLSGCSQNGDDEPIANTQLISRNWQVQTAQYAYSNLTYTYYQKGGTSNDADLSAYRFEFRNDGSYSFQDDSTTYRGNWELMEEGAKLRLDGVEVYNVLTLSESNFDFSFTSEEVGTDNKTITVEYTYRLIPAD